MPALSCAINTDCAFPTPICNKLSNTCVGCLQTTDCPSGKYCDALSCTPIPACLQDMDCAPYPPYIHCGTDGSGGTDGRCQQCTLDSNCLYGMSCENGFCQNNSVGSSSDNKTIIIISSIVGGILLLAVIAKFVIFRN